MEFSSLVSTSRRHWFLLVASKTTSPTYVLSLSKSSTLLFVCISSSMLQYHDPLCKFLIQQQEPTSPTIVFSLSKSSTLLFVCIPSSIPQYHDSQKKNLCKFLIQQQEHSSGLAVPWSKRWIGISRQFFCLNSYCLVELNWFCGCSVLVIVWNGEVFSERKCSVRL